MVTCQLGVFQNSLTCWFPRLPVQGEQREKEKKNLKIST